MKDFINHMVLNCHKFNKLFMFFKIKDLNNYYNRKNKFKKICVKLNKIRNLIKFKK